MQVGPYEVRGELGRGGMGVVYRARHAELGHEVALKLLAPSAGSSARTDGLPETRSGDSAAPPELSSARWIERFRREAQAAGRLGTHDGIVGVLDVGEDQGRLYLAMQLIEGHALDEELRGRVLDVPEAFRIVGAVARAVDYAHGQGIIHRDLKPGNILLDRDQGVWVTDFGLAARTALDAESQKITRTQDVVGTPAYLAPEQLRGEAVDARTDVHALGCTLYELLTGATPFESKWLPVTCRRVLQDIPAPPSSKRPEVSRGADAVVLRCLEKDPAARFATAAELAAECERIARGDAPLTRPSGIVRRAARWTARRRLPLGAAAAVVCAGAAGLGAIAWSGRAQESAEQARTRTGEATAQFDARRSRAVEFGRLAQRTQADIRLLQDHFHEVAVAPDAVAAAVARVRTAAGAVAADEPGAAAAAAWVALAELYAGTSPDPWAAFARVPAADASDPFPAMVTALARVETLVKGWRTAGRRTGPGGAPAALVGSQQEEEALREAAERALAAVPPVRPEHFNAELTALYELLAGARLVVARQHEQAVAALTPSQDDPFLGALATYLLGRSALRAGQFEASAQYLEALAAARGWRDALRGQVHALAMAAQRSRAAPAAWQALLERAEAVVERLFAGTPRPADYGERGRIRVERAVWLYEARRDRRDLLDGAIADLERERQADPAYGAIILSFALVLRASDGIHAGEKVRPLLERARQVLLDAAAESPEREQRLLEQRVNVETEMAALACREGVPPGEAFAAAIDAARALLRRYPEAAAMHHLLGTVFLRQSDACTRHNADPAPARAAAIAALRAALKHEPAFAIAKTTLGTLLAAEGRAAAAAGRPFESIFAEGEALLRAAEADPFYAMGARADRALLNHYWAEARWNRGGDALPLLAEARALMRGVLEAEPARTKWLLRAAEIELFVVRARHAQRQSAESQLQRAGDLIGRSGLTAVTERDAAALTAGRFHRLRGDDLALRGLDPMPAWNEAVTFYSALLERQPRWGEALLQRATCRLSAARYARFTLKHTGLPLLDNAIADLDTYLGLWPGDAAVWANRGSAFASKGDALEGQGQDPVPWWNRALADLAKAGELSPSMWQVHANRGLLLEGMERLEEALAAFEAALAANPKAPGVDAMAARVRKRLGK